jgi:hypothetical protein
MVVATELPLAPCPKCAALVPMVAEFCTECRISLRDTPIVPPDELAAIDRELSGFTAEAGAAPEPDTTPTFRVGTYVWCAVGLGLFALGAISKGDAGIVLGWGIGCVAATIALFYLIPDLVFLSVRARSSGYDGARCFIRALKWGRWKNAFACMAPVGRGRAVARPALPNLECPELTFVLDSPAELKRYWKPIVRSGGGRTRRIMSWRLRPIGAQPRIERYMLDMRIQAYPSWIPVLILLGIIGLIAIVVLQMTMTKSQSVSYPIMVVQHRSRWYVVSGGVYPPVDRALLQPGATAT